MEVTKINPSITLLKYEDCESMNRTFVRITSYLECPQFKGQIFTLGQYRKWYSGQFGGWTYHTDWGGHNIPSVGLEPFCAGDFDPLTPDEQVIINLFCSKQRPFYVIALAEDSRGATFDHEMAHAFFGTNLEYRKEVEEAIKPYWKQLKPVRDLLTTLGYSDEVFMDETHAYVGVDSGYLDDKNVKYPAELSKTLKNIYRKYYV